LAVPAGFLWKHLGFSTQSARFPTPWKNKIGKRPWLVGVARPDEHLGRLPFGQYRIHHPHGLRPTARSPVNRHAIIGSIDMVVQILTLTEMQIATEDFLVPKGKDDSKGWLVRVYVDARRGCVCSRGIG
jgi:hypothetical protein